ncbi:MAG: glycosyltransferase [Chitinophagaceae bacterium]
MNKKPTILIITFCIPWPVADGGKMYGYTSVNWLKRHYDITLLISVYNQQDLEDAAHLHAIWPDVRIEVVNYIKQQGPKEKFKKSLRDFYYAHFSKREAAQSHVFFNLRKKITNIFLLSNNLLSKCEQLFTENVFDIVQVEYSTNIGCVNFIPEGQLKVYVEIESLYSIMEDYMAVGNDRSFGNKYLVTCAKNIELDFMKRYDAIFSLNNSDQQRISRLLPGLKVFNSPFAVPDEYFTAPELLDSWKPEKLIFIGSENHFPNKEGLEWYAEEILPLIKNSSVTCYITGTWSDTFRKRMSGCNKLVFTGFVKDLSEIMANSIMIVPIRLGGGGIRAKVIQAMAFGIPLISTSLGCMGIETENGGEIIVCDDAPGFAQAIDQLLSDRRPGLQMIKAASVDAWEKYSEAAAGNLRHGFYQRLLAGNNHPH